MIGVILVVLNLTRSYVFLTGTYRPRVQEQQESSYWETTIGADAKEEEVPTPATPPLSSLEIGRAANQASSSSAPSAASPLVVATVNSRKVANKSHPPTAPIQTDNTTNPPTTPAHPDDDADDDSNSCYDQIITWPVLPDNSNFKSNPYRLFCRWRNAVGSTLLPQWIESQELRRSKCFDTTSDTKKNKTQQSDGGGRNVLLDVQLDCYQTMKQSPFGTGNWVQFLYLLRLGVATFPTHDNKEDDRNIGNMDLQLTCIDNDDDPSSSSRHLQNFQRLVMPWLTGRFSSVDTLRVLNRQFNDPAAVVETKCFDNGAWGVAPVGWMTPFIQHDLRRMAIALVGIPTNDPSHPVHEWLRQQQQQRQNQPGNSDHPAVAYRNTTSTRVTALLPSFHISTNGSHSYYSPPPPPPPPPLIPNVVLDDVVIHFRCGDIMASKENYFRFLKFDAFASRIKNDDDDDSAAALESIGIVTQPFGKKSSELVASLVGSQIKGDNDENENRSQHQDDNDGDDQERGKDQDDVFRTYTCRKVTMAFVDYLQDRFPKARITIHNGPNETIALAYARFVMAKRQAFAYPDSSFSVFPVLATFGTGFHLYPVNSPYSAAAKNEWLRNMAETDPATKPFFQGDAAAGHRPGRIEWMRISPEDSLFGIETLHMKRAHPTDPARVAESIVEWFRNDTAIKPTFPRRIS